MNTKFFCLFGMKRVKVNQKKQQQQNSDLFIFEYHSKIAHFD